MSNYTKNKIAINGIDLTYYATDKKEHKVLFIHGGPGLDSTTFFPSMLKLKDSFQLYFLDLRGNGFSEDCNDGNYGLKDYADDIKEFVLSVVGDEKKTLGLVGHSFGGCVAIEALSSCKDLFDYSVLVSSPFNSSWISDLMNYYENNKDASIDKAESDYANNPSNENFNLLTQAYWYYYFPELKEDEAKGIIKKWVYRHPPYDFSNEKIMPQLDLEDKLKNINVPTLVLGVDRDLIIPWAHLEELSSKINNSKIFCLKDTGHFSFLTKIDLFKRELNSFVKDFLQE